MKNTILFLLVGALAGCGSSPTPPPVYLGHVATTSGPGRAIGEHEGQGIRLAIEDLTRTGQDRVGNRPVVVKHTDARGQLDAMEGQAVRLSTVSRVVALYGGNTADEVARLDHSRIPLVTPLGNRPHGVSELVFSTGLTSSSQAYALARFAVEEKNILKIAILVDERREQSRALADAFERAFQKVSAEKYPKEEAAKPSRVTFGKDVKLADVAQRRIEAATIQGVLFAGTAEDYEDWRKAFSSDDFVIFFGGDDGSLRESRPKPAFTASAFAVDKELPKTVEFAKKYHDAFKEDADVHAALAYDGIRILVEAIQRAQIAGSEGPVEELRKTKDFAGLTGPLTFGSDQELRRAVFVGKTMGSHFSAIKRYNVCEP